MSIPESDPGNNRVRSRQTADDARIPQESFTDSDPASHVQQTEGEQGGMEAPHGYPVFYDAERRRWPWFVRLAIGCMLLGFIGLAIFVLSLAALPLMPYNALPKLVNIRDVGNLDPILNQHADRARKPAGIHLALDPMRVQHEDRVRRLLDVHLAHEKQKLRNFNRMVRAKREERRRKALSFLKEAALRSGVAGDVRSLLSAQPQEATRIRLLPPAAVPKGAPPVVASFYVDWEQSSLASAEHNIGNLTHFIPEWLHLKPAGANYADPDPNVFPFVDARQPSDKTTLVQIVRAHRVPILPLVNNYTSKPGQEEGDGDWDTNAVHQLVSNPAARTNFILRLRTWLLKNQMQGVNIDFESIDVDDRAALVLFMRELYSALHPYGLLVTQDIEVESEAYDLKQLVKWNDWIVPMFYDQHAGGTEPGPVAGIDWTRRDLAAILRQIPPAKIVMGVANQAYNWVNLPKRTDADSLSYEGAVMTARESQPDAVIHLAPGSLNPTFSYSEDAEYAVDQHGHKNEEPHVVWMLDAVTAYNQLHIARPTGIRGAALWVMGEEDPSVWTFFNKALWTQDWSGIVRSGGLDRISFAGTGQIDFDGEGELLQPIAEPAAGVRSVQLDPNTGLITAESYAKDSKGNLLVPTSYVVRRYGGTDNNLQKKIVLTFDDGPDPTWTPQILDILKEYHVPAVFFVVGKMAEENPGLVRREWDEGHLIGNHTWDHPELDDLMPAHQKVELTSTQRVIQAITGHSTTLFRPPYGNDVEPQTGKEVRPLDLAAGMNYITVGQKNDPQDWNLYENKPGTESPDLTRPRAIQSIVDSVVVNRDVGSIVLLHDAGGDRSRTVAALPQIITRLRALGYRFVGLDELSGIPRDKLMPVITGRDTVLAGADRYLFETTYLFQRTLTTLFLLSIWLGVSRIVLFLALALIQRQREKRRVFPPDFTPFVSVVVAAYNEEKVIARTVQALLDSGYPHLEVIVVDDGSKDRTYEVVQEQFGSDPRVRALRQQNGGKASALNRGLKVVQGEVVVSLDADTLFAPETIWQLARHFADPSVGAVSGNVRVGNAHNLFTKWQALEYTTSQNFDRRGYDLLNCITVVPGAVGALRREAVMAVGGYTGDTLAEDTDLTWKLRRAGWRIVNDNSAMAYTEAPETLRNLARQRFRWAFGTLQCLWKHRDALFSHGAFGWLALPSLWIYQILFPAVSPFMDIGIVYSLIKGNFLMFFNLFALMLGVELVAAFIALRMDRGNLRLLPYLVLQRFVYRQLMYYVVLKSLVAAVRGGAVGWNKLERTGTARIEGKAA